jgi:hypothetical protein
MQKVAIIKKHSIVAGLTVTLVTVSAI